MKEISEAWQMRIFDLLEGNLSEGEKATVLAEIGKDPDLQREYRLMAQTYLKPEEQIIFTRKEDLYRKPGLLVFWSGNRAYAAAAAVALLLAGTWMLWPQNNQPEDAVRMVQSHTPANAEKAPANVPAIAGSATTQQKIAIIPKATPVPDEFQNDKREFPVPENHDTFRGDPLPVFAGNIAETTVITGTDSGYAPEIIVTELGNLPVSQGKKRSLTYRLLNSSRKMLANLQFPDVSLKATRKKGILPHVEMSITTKDEQVIATLIE
ncbi:MAG: hypothetical protein JNL57_12725 [Bacteroidetes bacterium]|nr:hypothetical protein [Bacteroidota bacterium]